jgi:hypothetical protein
VVSSFSERGPGWKARKRFDQLYLIGRYRAQAAIARSDGGTVIEL